MVSWSKLRFSILLLFIIVGVLGFASAATITVNQTGYNDSSNVYYESSNPIQAAISDSTTHPEDIIEVMSGTYEIDSSNSFNSNWLININKDNLIVKAAEGETPVILASMEEPFTNIKRIINIPNNNVTFEGFEIVGNGDLDFDGSYLGIRIDGSDLIVRDNVIKNTLTGIQANSIRANILKNKIYDVSVGISLMYKDSEYTVKDNEINVVKNSNISIDNEGFGLSSSNSIFENNTINVEGGVPEVKVHPEGSIQEGINAANEGDVVYVSPGLYNERIIIDKPLTLRGATYNENKNGYEVPTSYEWDTSVQSIINNPEENGTTILINNVGEVTIEGFVVQALNRGTNNINHLIHIDAESVLENVNILNNVIGPNTNVESQDGKKGRMNLNIDVGNSGASTKGFENSLVKGNKIFGAEGDGINLFIIGLYSSYGQHSSLLGTVIEDNEIYGSHRTGIETAGGISGLTIRNNKIYNNSGNADEGEDLKYGHGILIVRGSKDSGENIGLTQVNLTIEDNRIYNNEKSGIYFGPVNKDYLIRGNEIYNNGFDGIRLDMEAHFKNPTFEDKDRVGFFDKSENVFVNDNKIYGNGEKAINVIGTPTNGFFLNAQNNYWGTNLQSEIKNLISGKVSYAPWFTDEGMSESTIGQDITSDENGTNATINEDTNLSTENVIVNLPAGIIISGNSTWDGTINSPVIHDTTSVNISASGLERSISKVVEVGFSGVKLTFDKAVKIVISGESGNKVGYSDEGEFVLIPLCNSEINERNLPEGGDCYYDNTTNNEIVIWTKHFTQFITFDENDSTSPTFNDAWSYPILPTILKPITIFANFTDASGIAYAVTRTYYQYLDGTSDTSFGDNNMTFDYSEGDGTTSIWNYTIPMTPSEIDSEGYFKIKFKAVDGSGNIRDFPGSSSYDVYVTVDLTAPNTTSSHNYTFVENTTQINLSAEDIDLDYSGNYQPSRVNYTSFRINKNSWINVSGNFTLSEFDFNEDGDYEIEFYSVDNAGNKEENKFAYVEIDTTAPALEIISPENKVYNNRTQLVNISSDGNVWYNWDGTNVSYSNPEEIVFNEGSNTLEVWANDSAGNVNYTSVTFIVDTTLPVVNITYPNNETYNVDVSELNYTFTESNQDKCWYSTNLGITNSSAVSCDNLTNVESVEGLNNWTIYMNDTAGWVGSDTIYFTKDTINPLIQFEIKTTESGNYSQNYIEANVSVSDDGTGINETITYLYNETTILNSTSLVSNFTGLEDGIYYLNATTYDNAGNSNPTETRTILLDTTAPEVEIISPVVNESEMNSHNIQVSVTDNLSNVKNVTIILENSTGVVFTEEMIRVGVSNIYEYSLGLKNLPSGSYTIKINSVDYAGNENNSVNEIFTLTDNVGQFGDVVTINGQVSASAGGTVSFVLPVTIRGNGTIVFAMDNLAGKSPTQLNARINSSGEIFTVGQGINFIGSESFNVEDLNQEVSNVQGEITLLLDIPGNNEIASGTYTIKYYIDND